MIIVGGIFEVDPGQRDEFVADRHDMMRKSRAEPGCLEYAFSADPIDPGRVLLFERWASHDALAAHLSALRAGLPSPGTDVVAMTSSITIYEVTAERQLGD